MNITLSQVLLVGALILFVFYIIRIRSELFDRLVFLVGAAAGILLVLDPELSTRVAHLLGIGRGADLIFYLAIIIGLFYAVGTRSRISRIEQKLTQVVREQAIANPIQGDPEAKDR
jgi:hypothetical protein